MARAPRIGFILAFLLVLFSVGVVSTYLYVRPLVANFLQAAQHNQRKETLPEPRQLDVHPPPTEPHASLGQSLGEALSKLDYATDLAAFKDFDATLQARLLHGDYASLEGFGAELVQTKSRFPGGSWKLQRFGETLAKCPTGEDSADTEWQAHLDRLKAWSLAYPHSKIASCVSGLSWTSFAWKARGTGYANTVTKESWQLFKERLAAGRSVLEGAPQEGRSPIWYSAMQVVALGQGWERAAYDRLFDQAVTSEPRYQSFYLRKSYYLLPRWNGSEGESEAFAAKAADGLGGEAGDEVFALVMMNLSNYQGLKEWRQSHVGDWPRIKRGFSAMGKEFGTSLRLENQCLRAAGYAGDLAFARTSALAIRDRLDLETWNSKEGFIDFRDWALCQGRYAPKH